MLTWGRGTSGQLGHSDRVNSPHPKLVMSLDTYFITHASAGWNHSGFVSGMFRKLMLVPCWRMLIESVVMLKVLCFWLLLHCFVSGCGVFS